ncbi:hypothetical protein SUGI_1027500 [Cryptomeria japonica]|nr:hypothetical protein SUGI_1027500 [Cryptomeria japonica]
MPGVIKKAEELSKLCGSRVFLVINSEDGEEFIKNFNGDQRPQGFSLPHNDNDKAAQFSQLLNGAANQQKESSSENLSLQILSWDELDFSELLDGSADQQQDLIHPQSDWIHAELLNGDPPISGSEDVTPPIQSEDASLPISGSEDASLEAWIDELWNGGPPPQSFADCSEQQSWTNQMDWTNQIATLLISDYEDLFHHFL